MFGESLFLKEGGKKEKAWQGILEPDILHQVGSIEKM
jgi:hypothetical protein